MQNIEIAIAQKLAQLKANYPNVGYQLGLGRTNYKYYVQLDFSNHDLSKNNEFNDFIADTSLEIMKGFEEYYFVFFFEKTNLIKTIIETYTPTSETILKLSQKNAYIGIEYSQVETQTIDNTSQTPKRYELAA